MNLKTVFDNNKVVIFGLISAVCIALVPYLETDKIEPLVLAYAAVIAVGSYVANNLRGQWVTIAGVVITSAANVLDILHRGGDIDIYRLLLTLAVNIGLTAAGPFKSRGYERTAVIQAAKKQGEEIKPTPIPK